MSDGMTLWVLFGVCLIARYAGETAWVCAIAMSNQTFQRSQIMSELALKRLLQAYAVVTLLALLAYQVNGGW